MKTAPLLSFILTLCFSGAVYAQIGDIGLKGCSVAEHGRSTNAEVTAFINKILDSEGMGGLSPGELMEFRWVDLAGNGRCELLFTRWGAAVTRLYIEWPSSAQVLLGETSLLTKTLPGNPGINSTAQHGVGLTIMGDPSPQG